MLVCRAAVKKRWNPDQGHHHHHHFGNSCKKSWPFLACFRGASGWWFFSFESTLEGYSPLLLIVFVCFLDLFSRILYYFLKKIVRYICLSDKKTFFGTKCFLIREHIFLHFCLHNITNSSNCR